MTTLAAPVRWGIVSLGAVALAGATGLTAAYAQTGGWDALRFFAFAGATAAAYGSMIYLATAPDDLAPPEHNEDSVESAWLQRALAGSALDLFIVAGVLTGLTSVLGLDEPGISLALLLVMADVAVRYAIIARRES